MTYVVTAPAVMVTIRSGERTSSVRFVEEGGHLPEGVAEEAIEHLLAMGMIEELSDDPSVPEAQAAGDDLSAMSAADLRALAADRGVEVAKTANKKAIITALTATSESAPPAAPEGKDLADMTVDELRGAASAKGVEIPEGVEDSADLIALIQQ